MIDSSVSKDKSRKSDVIIYSIVFSVLAIIIIVLYFFWYDNYTTIAEEHGEYYLLDSMVYEFSYDLQDEIKSKSAEITNICLGKSKNGNKIYYVKPYNNLEYIAVYSAWDGSIYKRIGYMN